MAVEQKMVNGFVDIVNERYGYVLAIKRLREKMEYSKGQPKQETREQIRQLRKATRWLDEIAIPDSLRTLERTVEPQFEVSEWLAKAVSKK